MYHLVLLSELNILPKISAHAHTIFRPQFYDARTQCYVARTQCYVAWTQCYVARTQCYVAGTQCYVDRTQCYVFRSDISKPSPGKAAIERRRNFENL